MDEQPKHQHDGPSWYFLIFASCSLPVSSHPQVAEMKRRVEARRQELIDLRNGYDSDDDTHYVVDSRTAEVVLSVKDVVQ